MRKTLYLFLLFIALSLAGSHAQTAKIKEMRKQVTDLQKQISRKENILLSSKKDISSKIKNLDLLSAQIKERKELIGLLVGEVKAINSQITQLNKDIKEQEGKVATAKEEYASALKRSRRYGTFQDKLLFVVSASDFNSMIRRYRYAREYMQAYKSKGEELKTSIAALQVKKTELDSVLATKKQSLEEQEHQRKNMQLLQEEHKRIVTDLQRESKKVEKELKEQRKKLDKLNRDIEAAVERAVKEEQERERKAAKKRAEAKKSGKPVEPEYLENSSNVKLSGSFAQNKGKLPLPVTGPCHIVSTFGPQKKGVSKGNVMVDYGGIMIEGERGSKAACVFDGVVTSVIRQADFAFVLVRHGTYITVYSRLSDIVVKEGDKVKAGSIIGSIAEQDGHTCLQFQIRNETSKLNPMQWLRVR